MRLERAAVFASWKGHESEAAAAYREAVEATEGSGQQAAFVAAIRYARNVGDAELRRWVLERQLAVDSEAYAAWRELAQLEDESGGSGAAVLESLLELKPNAAQAHLLYARYLARAGQPDQAAAASPRERRPDRRSGEPAGSGRRARSFRRASPRRRARSWTVSRPGTRIFR